MAEALVKNGKHTVTAITREESKAEMPSGVTVKKVNYADPSTLVEAMRGNDALIITLAGNALDQEQKLIDAAGEAGVPWVIPNEWSPDMANEKLADDMIVGKAKRENRAYIENLGKSAWIGVSTGFWYEWSLAIPAAYGFDIKKKAVTLFNDGDDKICTSTWPRVGQAMAKFLSLPLQSEDGSICINQYKNKHIYFSSFTVSQNDMFDSLLRVTETKRDDWTVTKEPAKERWETGKQQMMTGDRIGFAKALYTRAFFPDGSGNVATYRELLNDKLGLPKEDIDEATKAAVKRSEGPQWGEE